MYISSVLSLHGCVNERKSYLKKLILARLESDEVQIKKIVEDAYRERALVKGTRTEKIVTRNGDSLHGGRIERSVAPSMHQQHHNTELEKLLKAPTLTKVATAGKYSSREYEIGHVPTRRSDIYVRSPVKSNGVVHVSNDHPAMRSNQDVGRKSYKRKADNNIAVVTYNMCPSTVAYSNANDTFNNVSSNVDCDETIGDIKDKRIIANSNQMRDLVTGGTVMIDSRELMKCSQVESLPKNNNNVIVLNQQFQFFTTNISESKTIYQNPYRQNDSKIIQINGSQYCPNVAGKNLFINAQNNIDHNDYVKAMSNRYVTYNKPDNKVVVTSNHIESKNTPFNNQRHICKNMKRTSDNSLECTVTKNKQRKVTSNSKSIVSKNHTLNVIQKTENKVLVAQSVTKVSTGKDHHYEKNDEVKHNVDNENVQNPPNKDILNELMSLELCCDVNDEISSTVEEYFNNLDILSAHSESVNKPNNVESAPVKKQVNIPENNNATSVPDNIETSQKNTTSTICFLCDYIGKHRDFEDHIKSKHKDFIFLTMDGSLSVTLDVGAIRNSFPKNQTNCFIEYRERLYVLHFEYRPPDLIAPILLSLSCEENGKDVLPDKFFLQIINHEKEEEFIWSGNIENVNNPERPHDIDVYSDRVHGYFDISLRSLDLVPNNLALKDILKYLDICSVDFHLFIDARDDIHK